MWVGTSTGLFSYNKVEDRIIRFESEVLVPPVKVLKVLPDSSILAGTANGLFVLANDTFKSVVLNETKNKSINTITGVFTDNHGNCWLSTLDGLVRYSWNNGKTERFCFEKEPLAANNAFTAICTIRNKIYLGTPHQGLVEFDLTTKAFTQGINIGSCIILTLANDNDDHLFVGTNGGGLKVVELNSGKIETIENKENDPLSLSSNSIYSFYIDENSRYWIGTYSGGVNYSKELSGKFELHQVTTNYPVESKSIRSFYFAPNGRQYFWNTEWLGTDKSGWSSKVL